NGWTLSTTRAAAQLMAALEACAWDASSDQVLDWLKQAPEAGEAGAAVVRTLERALRKAALAAWPQAARHDWAAQPELAALVVRVQAWRDSLGAARSLPQWLQSVRGMLVECGQWDMLEADAAGARVLTALRLQAGQEA